MIKNSSQEYKYQYLRYDTEWQFKWNVAVDADGTIKFYPLKKAADGSSWYFCGEGDPNTGDWITHDENVWDASNPVFEYHVVDSDHPTENDGTGPNAYTNAWDALHPRNLTRYLRQGDTGIIHLSNTIEHVHIDTVAPKFISDDGTDYILFKKQSETNSVRNCSFVFTDDVGLDYRQIAIKLGNDILYSYNRQNDDLQIDADKIKSISIKADGNGKYKVEFELTYGLTKEEVNELNQKKIIIDVFDKSANHKEYEFGNDGSAGDEGKKEWKVIITDIDFSKLDRLIIKYYDIKPTDMIVDVNTVGTAWVSIYNPNKDYWDIPIVYQLTDDSVGTIDESTYDDSSYKTDGVIKFKVTGIDECGNITTQAWLESGNGGNMDKSLFSATFTEATLGFWRVLDPEGRLYDLGIYVPTFLRHTEWFNFAKFFELYLNSCYTDMKKRKCISALEKTARILDFNEVDRLEDELLPHYAKQHGFEFDVDLESIARIFEGKVDE